MQQPQIVLYIIKLTLGGFTAFLAIMLWSKTRDPAWMSLVVGAVISYAGIVFEMMVNLGLVSPGNMLIGGIPVLTLLFTGLPSIFFILAFILMLTRSR
jgi:hypothetical protein